MRNVLLLTSLASVFGTAVAVVDIDHPILQRDVNALLPRETKVSGDVSSKCSSALSGVLSSIPTAPPKLLSAVEGQSKTETDPCSYHPPSSVSKEYSSYTSDILSWYSKHSKEVDAAFKVCTELKSQAAGLVHICSTDKNVPTGLLAAATATDSDHSKSTETSSHKSDKHSTKSGSSATGSSSTSTGAAPRETGMAFAAIAAGLVAAAL
ncbi:hypothetical protein LIA77_07964 [Sarocladium implicatum]|jgi:hypothetical protein|nr:hypothetical protein LIA77_07964 [Sarocladium implicatum]